VANNAGIEVEQIAWPEELALLETSHLLHGQTELKKAAA